MATPSRLSGWLKQRAVTLCSTPTTPMQSMLGKDWLRRLPTQIPLVVLLWYSIVLVRVMSVLTSVPEDLLLWAATLTIACWGNLDAMESE